MLRRFNSIGMYMKAPVGNGVTGADCAPESIAEGFPSVIRGQLLGAIHALREF